MARALTAITEVRGLPRTIKSDNGSEFISKVTLPLENELSTPVEISPLWPE